MPESDEEIFNFDSSDAIEAVFAGNLTGNLLLIEKVFSVRTSSRGHSIKIMYENASAGKRACGFLAELVKIQKCVGKANTQEDFEQLLAAYRSHKEKEVHSFFSERIKVGRKKQDIVPRTKNQLEYVRSIKIKDIVFGIGPAGTGKTYLAMAMAVSEFIQGNYSRIILTRPAREAGENLGFLPGNLEEKILPYLRPLYDALYDMLDFDEARTLIEKNIIELAPLAFMRGRTLNHAFVILDEAQNTSPDQMLMFLTRLGLDSCCVITGDPSQTDLPKNQESGLTHAQKVLAKVHEIAFCHFTSRDVVRHSLVEKIIEAYSTYVKKASSFDRKKETHG